MLKSVNNKHRSQTRCSGQPFIASRLFTTHELSFPAMDKNTVHVPRTSSGDTGGGQMNGMSDGGERTQQEQMENRCLAWGTPRRMGCFGEECSSKENSKCWCMPAHSKISRRPQGLVEGPQEGRREQSARVLCGIHSWVFFCTHEGQSIVVSIRKVT